MSILKRFGSKKSKSRSSGSDNDSAVVSSNPPAPSLSDTPKSKLPQETKPPQETMNKKPAKNTPPPQPFHAKELDADLPDLSSKISSSINVIDEEIAKLSQKSNDAPSKDTTPLLANEDMLELAKKDEAVILNDSPEKDEPDGDNPSISDDLETILSIDKDIRPKTQRINMSEVRLDVVRIASDIESGGALYRRAQQRIEGLTNFLDQAETATSMLEQLEPEHRRLKSKTHALESDLRHHERETARLEAALDDEQNQATDLKKNLQLLKTKLIQTADVIKEQALDIESRSSENETLKIKAERIKTNLDIEVQENINLREKINSLSENLDGANEKRLDFIKQCEVLQAQIEELQDIKQSQELELSEIKLAFRESQRENQKMKKDFATVKSGLVNVKAAHEESLHRQEDKIVSLEAHIEELQGKLQIKEDIVKNTVSEVSQLRKERTALDIEQEKFVKALQAQNQELEFKKQELERTQHELMELNISYKQVADALTLKQSRQPTQAAQTTAAVHKMDEIIQAELLDRFPELKTRNLNSRNDTSTSILPSDMPIVGSTSPIKTSSQPKNPKLDPAPPPMPQDDISSELDQIAKILNAKG